MKNMKVNFNSKRNFRKNTKGIGWVLGVAFLSLALTPIVYFPLSYAWDQIYGFITDSYTFTGITASSTLAVQLIISYLMAFVVFFTASWAITQAKRARYE